MKVLIALLFLLLVSSPLFAQPNFENQVSIGDQLLVLNGVGIRKATIFKVKVYYAGLYLKQKISEPSVILSDQNPKQIIMKFVRDVSASKLRDAWEEGVKSNSKQYAPFAVSVEQLNTCLLYTSPSPRD